MGKTFCSLVGKSLQRTKFFFNQLRSRRDPGDGMLLSSPEVPRFIYGIQSPIRTLVPYRSNHAKHPVVFAREEKALTLV